ncbi:N-acetylglucosamine-6-phosphate deacetylase [Microvirga sp. Mcv34]|uniref:N-acetylglucosamine-6-phosphate deacetylase n=1 Tax=Microvirga sp. Mcv34 TaxID=2926016 RepID=UPI0021C77820|nr:N-acetylglucosamine-6-phosphate deacetylase [Microvirga sp. Mcv34]
MRTGGLFDLQVNGFAGVDFNSETIDADALDHALEAMLATGVTACLPTLITAPDDRLAARFFALDRAVAQSRLGPLMVPGYHLEGPFLNSGDGYSGCHPPEAMRPPDVTLVERLSRTLARPILLVTIAPELAGSETFIRKLAGEGRVVAIGHSAAGAETVVAAAEAGARLSTHLGNGLPQILPKLDNSLFAQLAEDRLSATFIADGIHLPPHALKAMLRAKGRARAILVTDAVSAAAAPPGLYPFAATMVEHAADGSVRLPGSAYLAGSALVLDQAVRNLVDWGLSRADEALSMASDNPRRLMAAAIAALAANQPSSEVLWSDRLYPLVVRVGSIERRYDQERRSQDHDV